MKNLLNNENSERLKQMEKVGRLIVQFKDSYHTTKVYICNSNPRGNLKFNGNSRLSIEIENDLLTISVSCFGFRNHPAADLSKVSGCSDEGTVKYMETEIDQIVNDLAEYDKIFPIK